MTGGPPGACDNSIMADDARTTESPCTWQDAVVCEDCDLGERLTCRFGGRALARFYALLLPAVVPAAGTLAIHALTLGGWPVAVYAAFLVLFFGVIETRLLCRHCPFYAREGAVLRCPANFGVPRLWRSDPRPSSTRENVLLALGFLFLGLFPVGVGVLGLLGTRSDGRPGFVLFALLTPATALGVAVTFALVRRWCCTRCVNFSCFLNRAPSAIAEAYLDRNPAWRRVTGGRPAPLPSPPAARARRGPPPRSPPGAR